MMRLIRAARAWLAFRALCLWPGCPKNHGIGRLYWSILPYAGEWAYQQDCRDAGYDPWSKRPLTPAP